MGVSRIKTVGEIFNPNLHEAVSSEGDGKHEIISEELQAGYVLGDTVLRPAMVRVTMGTTPKSSYGQDAYQERKHG